MQIYSIWFKYTFKEMLIIGIAGGTGSGKTTVVRKIIESLPVGGSSTITTGFILQRQ